jgi:O-antigen/teichoic acid export membrane protein
MSNVRVTYSGLISLVVGLASVVTGLVFTLIVTRKLTPDEFGTWSLIGGLITYVIIIEPIIAYWATREISRGIESGKTAIITSAVFSALGVFGYIIVAFIVGLQTDADLQVLLLASILIPVMFLNRTLTAINLGWKPEVVSYGIISFEIIKIPIALILVYYLNLGIEGAIITTALAHLTSVIVLAIYAKNKIKGELKKLFVKKWLKLSWLPLYPGFASLIYTLDVLVFTVIVGSVEGLAFWAVAIAISSLVIHSGSFSRALYPKLLQGGKQEHLEENLIRFFYFAIPLTVISMVFAKPGLFALNPIYEIAVPVVLFLALRAFFNTLSSVFASSISGIEKVDVNKQSTFKDYIKSKLFLIPTLQLIQYSIYIGSLVIVLLITKSYESQINLIIYWAIIAFVIQIPFTIYYLKIVKINFTLNLDYTSLTKYLFVSISVFGAVYLIMDEYLIYKNSIFEFLPNVILYAVVGVLIYLGITYFIDPRTKKLVHSVINELKK